MNPGGPRDDDARPRRVATVLESVEEIRAAARGAAIVREAVAAPPPETMAGAPAPAGDTQPYRPSARPPMAVLTAFDDGAEDGEAVRIRACPFVIGRAEGHLVIPHDGGMSARHAELVQEVEDGRVRWLLRDLQSTNGTFVRASRSLLRHDQEFLVGATRLRFDAPPAGPAAADPAAAAAASTRKWQAPRGQGSSGAPAASLMVLSPWGPGQRVPIDGEGIWIGRDAGRCRVVLDDPTVDPGHARVFRDERGRWVVQNGRSLNGLWIRIREMALERAAQFQCGEQRFSIRFP